MLDPDSGSSRIMVSMMGSSASSGCFHAKRKASPGVVTRGDETPNLDSFEDAGRFGWAFAVASRGSSICERSRRRRRGRVAERGVGGSVGLSGVVGVDARLGGDESSSELKSNAEGV